MRIIRLSVEEVNGKFPILAGTGRAGTKLTIEMSQKAQRLGVDGALIVTPYYNLATEEGLYRHFKSIADNAASLQFSGLPGSNMRRTY